MKTWHLCITAIACIAINGNFLYGRQTEEKSPPRLAKGLVFHDANGNGKFDESEKPLAAIGVSNGRDVVVTDAAGRYEIPIDDDAVLFVIKPRGWRPPLSKMNLPKFYYVHKPAGSPKSQYAGVAPTGPLPESIDFPLAPQDEPDEFQAIFSVTRRRGTSGKSSISSTTSSKN